jgi:thioredoxin reductase/SAM-dependent methyltransferase
MGTPSSSILQILQGTLQDRRPHRTVAGMSTHAPRAIERHTDVAVVGGSAAGLAAALQLGRQRRSVIVIDAGAPRNAPAAEMHGYLGRDGQPPSSLLAEGREEVRGYGGEVLDGRVVDVAPAGEGRFRLTLTGGHVVVARRVMVATGLVDELPEIDGLGRHWGRSVIHCPFCHGYEARDGRIVQLVTHPLGLHTAPLFRQLTDRLTIVVHGAQGVDRGELDALRAGGVRVVEARVRSLVTDGDGRLTGVALDGGDVVDADVVAVSPRFHVAVEPFAPLGLVPTPHASGLGDVLAVDGTGLTTVPGVYAAGNVTDPSAQVAQAAAAGSRVGAMISFSLAEEDVRLGDRRSANADDWDARYGDAPMWSGNANGSLVTEVQDLAPGRALDVGAGEGADVLWLAERGWEVTASDISGAALGRVGAEAERLGRTVRCVRADANAQDPFGGATFDLVTAMYASIPRTPDGRGVRNLLGAVAPGGTLLVVSHDLAPMRHPIDPAVQSRPFDPDAYVRVEDLVGAVGNGTDWDVLVHETRPRPPGAASGAHHVDDVVLRLRRHRS